MGGGGIVVNGSDCERLDPHAVLHVVSLFGAPCLDITVEYETNIENVLNTRYLNASRRKYGVWPSD